MNSKSGFAEDVADLFLLLFLIVFLLIELPQFLGGVANCTFGNAGDFGLVQQCQPAFMTHIVFGIQLVEFVVLTIPAIIFAVIITSSHLPIATVLYGILSCIGLFILISLAIKMVRIRQPLTHTVIARWILLVASLPCMYLFFVYVVTGLASGSIN